ncbi:hypothetical protein O181_014373 [Austropuccinia psidii MF-1]|uniref:Retrovirus-related Pol polyprotein from transposon TNT 1-94-like beta-barrel domain-containing protein n=1 Tax=Austropuccinia psidii MF-1 TaxID=1389203 RepID=A0A9Q3C143_9BASI|nr:hypothetical protein [Austropuccinia psidii MF-1]
MTDKITDSKDLTNIPILDGTSFSQWNIQMKIHLRAKDLLDVCKKSLPGDATIPATNKWTKASHDAINIITTRISELESLTLNDELIERPNLVLTCLQDYVHLTKTKDPSSTNFPSALVSTSNESFKIIDYCTNVKNNPKSTTHKKEECWAENPQLRPNQKDNKQKKFQLTAYFLTAKALITSSSNTQSGPSQVILDCGATHHIFDSKTFFISLRNSSPFSVTTGDSKNSLRAYGISTIELYCKDQPLILTDCLFVAKLSCNLVSLLTLFEKRVIINRVEERFNLESKDRILLEGKVINKLMHIDHTLPIYLLTINHQSLWHKRLGNPSSQVLKMMGSPLESSICSTCEINKAQISSHSIRSLMLPSNHWTVSISTWLDLLSLLWCLVSITS